MNDEFLYRLRQPPPAAFAARLRARLETLVVARRFRRRQITLYSLIACLLGSTALALVVPAVRTAAHTVLHQVWAQAAPQSWPARVSQGSAELPPAARPAAETATVSSQSSARSSAVSLDVATRATAPAARAPTAQPLGNYASVGGFGSTPASELRPVKQLTLMGAAATAAAASAAIDEFRDLHPEVAIEYEPTSNERAFTKLCVSGIDVAMTTRLISSTELELCSKLGIEISVLPLAYEALAVIVNPANDWVEALKLADLKRLFSASSAADGLVWSQLNSSWPSLGVESFTPRSGIGFGDTFNELVSNTNPQQHRLVAAESLEEANRLQQRVARTFGGITYVPYAYYLKLEQQPSPKLLKIINDDELEVLPSRTSIANGSYPLARPLLLFIKRSYARSRGAEALLDLMLRTADRRLMQSAYLPLTTQEYQLAMGVLAGRLSVSFDLRGIRPVNAREILLRQVPEDLREEQRRKLAVN